MSDKRFEDLVRHLMRFGRTREEAEDIAQEALFRVWKKKPEASWGYLLTTAKTSSTTSIAARRQSNMEAAP